MAKFTADEFFKLPNPKRPDRGKVLIDVIQGGKALEVVLSGNKITPMLFPKAKNINSVKQIIDLKFGDKTGFSAIRLKGADGKDYKISNLNKSKEFGGGGGRRG